MTPSANELLDGEEKERENPCMYDNGQMIEMLARIQRLESQRIIIAVAIIVIGIGIFPATHSVFEYSSQTQKHTISIHSLRASEIALLRNTPRLAS